MNLRQRLREETRGLHHEVEMTYPFCLLMSENLSLVDLDKTICILKSVFSKHVKTMAYSHSFYRKKDYFFNRCKLGFQIPCSNFEHDLSLSLSYVFLGSNMGNQMVYKKNPLVPKSPHSAYFQTPVPKDLWNDMLRALSKVEVEEDQNAVVDGAKLIFQELIKNSKLV